MVEGGEAMVTPATIVGAMVPSRARFLEGSLRFPLNRVRRADSSLRWVCLVFVARECFVQFWEYFFDFQVITGRNRVRPTILPRD